MGVDAGGDAFALAQEMYTEADKTVAVTQESAGVIERAAATVERYQARIDEQAKLLGTQANRIQRALSALQDVKKEQWERISKAQEHLLGVWDDAT